MSTATHSTETAPAQPKGLSGLKWRVRGLASACVLPLMQRAGRAYVGGVSHDDALCVTQRLAGDRYTSTIGCWNSTDEPPPQVAADMVAALEGMAATGLDCYLSIKPPALGFRADLATDLARAAAPSGIRLHCDSHGPEVAEPSLAMMEVLLAHLPPRQVSLTIPGRWLRSVTDANWAVERGCPIRVVKGQWPDPFDPQRDMRAGFLEVIDRLAGRAELVGVASHDVPLAAEAISRLRAADTACELELLFGMPLDASLEWAAEHHVAVRIYVPYGAGYIPHAINQLRRNPRFAWWMLKSLVTPRRRSRQAIAASVRGGAVSGAESGSRAAGSPTAVILDNKNPSADTCSAGQATQAK